MQYFQAVQEGKRRAAKAQMALFDVAGFAMLTLTTKKVNGKFLPVGEEEHAAVIRTEEGCVVVICDGDGFTKAQSKALKEVEADRVFEEMVRAGTKAFVGRAITMWARTHPVIRGG